MKSLNVVKHVSLGGIQGWVLRVMDTVTLEQSEEALTGGVIAAMADCTHRADQRVVLEKPLVVTAAKLAAADALLIVKPRRLAD